jgi:hypothetical protein
MWSMRDQGSGAIAASNGDFSAIACASLPKIHHSSRRSPRGATTRSVHCTHGWCWSPSPVRLTSARSNMSVAGSSQWAYSPVALR